ncbi:MAG: hypothetical protein IT341_07570 [Chloroflexi bacterium]|nr:hypothetical protein [Chloroflexota bacterium]
MLLRIGLEIADFIVNLLPARAAYALADVAGDTWYRLGTGRRHLVAANLARGCAATGRPVSGPPFVALVRAAFRHHARYYLEILRAPHYDSNRMDQIVTLRGAEALEPVVRGGGLVLVTCHLGNFEPFGLYLAALGRPALAPIEEIEPRELYEFLAARRGASSVELVPVRQSRAALSRRLREGGVVGIVGDRLTGGAAGHPVTMFGHATTIPNGPAVLALTHDAPVVVGRCLRVGPDRFEADGEVILLPTDGDRRARVAALTERIAARFEHDIGEAPEQWWGAFQSFWPDILA